MIERYNSTVKRDHTEYIEPTRKKADIIVPVGKENKVAIDLLVQNLKLKLNDINGKTAGGSLHFAVSKVGSRLANELLEAIEQQNVEEKIDLFAEHLIDKIDKLSKSPLSILTTVEEKEMKDVRLIFLPLLDEENCK